MPARHFPISPAMAGAAALLGAATGLRSQIGVAALVVRNTSDRLPSPLRSKTARRVVVTAALGELAADKYPGAPARTEPLGLAARLGLGGVAGWLVGQSRGAHPFPLIAVGAVSAGATAFVGRDLRARLSRRFPHVAVAVAEDGVAVALAFVGSRALHGDRPRQAPVL